MSRIPDYRGIWRRELDAGINGQDPALTATWKLDNLWRAAALQYKAEETERFMLEAIDNGYHREVVAHYLEQLEQDIADCHRAFTGEASHAAA